MVFNDFNDRKDISSSSSVLPSFEEESQLQKCNEIYLINKKSLDDNLVKELYETRRINCGECFVNQKDDDPMMIELNLRFKFDDNSQRSLQCYFPNNFFLLLENFEDVTKEFDFKKSNLIKDNNVTQSDLKIIEQNTSFLDKIENVCLHLTSELVDFGLVNVNDQMTINELFLSTIKKYVF